MKKIKRLNKAKNPIIKALRAKGYGKKEGHPKGFNRLHPLALSPEILQAAREAAELALPDYIIASVLGISAQTMCAWSKDYPEFVLAVTEGRAKRLKEIAVVENQILDGTAPASKYIVERAKMADRLINRIYPDATKQPVLIQSQEVTQKSKAELSYEAYRETVEATLTKENKTLILSKKGQL